VNFYRVAKNNTPANVLACYLKDPLEPGRACYCKNIMFVPRPNSLKNLRTYLHECAHFFLHRHDRSKPYHLRELEAETWALVKMRAGGLALPHEFVCESKRRIAKDIAGDHNKGIRIKKQAEEFARPYLHDAEQSDFINNVEAGIQVMMDQAGSSRSMVGSRHRRNHRNEGDDRGDHET
jgi:hypothetical protein